MKYKPIVFKICIIAFPLLLLISVLLQIYIAYYFKVAGAGDYHSFKCSKCGTEKIIIYGQYFPKQYISFKTIKYIPPKNENCQHEWESDGAGHGDILFDQIIYIIYNGSLIFLYAAFIIFILAVLYMIYSIIVFIFIKSKPAFITLMVIAAASCLVTWHTHIRQYILYWQSYEGDMGSIEEAITLFANTHDRLPTNINELIICDMLPVNSRIYYCQLKHNTLTDKNIHYTNCEYEIIFHTNLVTINMPQDIQSKYNIYSRYIYGSGYWDFLNF